MKPKSKKDKYTVICENSKQTCDVLNFIDNNSDRTWSHWEYVTRIGDGNSDIYDTNKYEFPVISFEKWQSLPDFPKPEYDPKDVALKKEVYSNSEFNGENKTLKGYKFKTQELLENFKLIYEGFSPWDDEFDLLPNNILKQRLESLGVIELWFNPVYNESITLKSGVRLSEDDIAEVKKLIEIRQVCKDLAK